MIRTVALFSAALAAAPAFADPAGTNVYHEHMWGGYGMGYGFIGFGLTILFWGSLIALAVLAVRWALQSGNLTPTAPKGDDALEILRQRLAKGEIDPEEYTTRKKALED